MHNAPPADIRSTRVNEFRHQLDDDLALLPPLPSLAPAAYAAIDAARDRIGEWMSWIGGCDLERTRQNLQQASTAIGAGTGFATLIEHKGEIAGMVSLRDVEPANRKAEISYWLANGQEGAGLVTRAVAAFVAHARVAMNLRRIEIRCSVDNPRSAAIPRRLGFSHEATLRNGDPLPNGRVTDQMLWASVADASPEDRPIEWTIPTERDNVRLALPQVHHAEAIFALIDSERARIGQWLSWVALNTSTADTKQWMEKSWNAMSSGQGVTAVILVDGKPAGSVGVFGINPVSRYGEIGYWIGAAHEGTGIMSAAVRAMESLAWSQFDVVRMQIRAAVGNDRSAKVAERCGFAREGVMQAEAVLNGQPLDMALYGKTREDS